MLQRVTMKSPRPFLASAIVAAFLCAAGASAHAEQDVFNAEVELDPIGDDVLDPTVYASLMPNPDVANPAQVQSAITAALAAPDTRPKTIVPITAPVVKTAVRPVRIDPNAGGSTPSKL